MGDPQFHDLVGRDLTDVFPIQFNAAGSGFDQSGDRMHRRRFAGTVGTDQSDDLRIVYFKAYPFNGFDHPVTDNQIFNLQHLYSPR